MSIVPLENSSEEFSIKRERKSSRIYEGMKEEEFTKLLDITKKDTHIVAFLLAYGSGLRVTEAINLLPEDVDIIGNKIFVRQGKGKKDRVVNTPRAFKEKYLKILPLIKHNTTKRSLEKAFLRLSYKAGINRDIGKFMRNGKEVVINKYHFHTLRSSFARRALEAGVPANQVQLLLGHSSLQTTTRYTKSNPTDAIKSILDRRV